MLLSCTCRTFDVATMHGHVSRSDQGHAAALQLDLAEKPKAHNWCTSQPTSDGLHPLAMASNLRGMVFSHGLKAKNAGRQPRAMASNLRTMASRAMASNLLAMASTLAPSSFLFPVAMPFVTSSFLFLVVRPGATSSVLVPSSDALCY